MWAGTTSRTSRTSNWNSMTLRLTWRLIYQERTWRCLLWLPNRACSIMAYWNDTTSHQGHTVPWEIPHWWLLSISTQQPLFQIKRISGKIWGPLKKPLLHAEVIFWRFSCIFLNLSLNCIEGSASIVHSMLSKPVFFRFGGQYSRKKRHGRSRNLLSSKTCLKGVHWGEH